MSGSSYIVYTSLGEKREIGTACYQRFYDIAQAIYQHNVKGNSILAKSMFNKEAFPDKIQLQGIKVFTAKTTYVDKRHFNLVRDTLEKWEGTKHYIISCGLDSYEDRYYFYIYLSNAPVYTVYLILNIIRVLDERYSTLTTKVFNEISSRKGDKLTTGQVMFLLFLMACGIRDSLSEGTVLLIKEHILGHSLMGFRNGVCKGAVRDIVVNGSLDYFEKMWVNAVPQDREGSPIFNVRGNWGNRLISAYFSPRGKELTALSGNNIIVARNVLGYSLSDDLLKEGWVGFIEKVTEEVMV